jgi:hypothetical protein
MSSIVFLLNKKNKIRCGSGMIMFVRTLPHGTFREIQLRLAVF